MLCVECVWCACVRVMDNMKKKNGVLSVRALVLVASGYDIERLQKKYISIEARPFFY